jgi:hypothetical protein
MAIKSISAAEASAATSGLTRDQIADRANSLVPITRYTSPTPTTSKTLAPTTSPYPVSTAPTLSTVDERSIREQTRKRMQSSIDAINANYANLISQERVEGIDRTGQTRAMNARDGLIGSDFGAAQQEKTTQYNKQQQKALVDQKNVQVTSVLQNIEDRASAEIKSRKEEALGQYTRDLDQFQQQQEQARSDFELLAKAGTDLNTLNPAQKAALFKQAGYDDEFGDLIFNAMKPKASQIDYKFEKLADGQGMFYGVDPATGELVTKNVSVDLPQDWSMTIAPDGSIIGFDKNTGQATVLSNKGEFAKPVDAASEFLDNPKKQAAFNQIVNKYSASPLIKASDRTVVLKGTVDALRADPSNGSKQLSLVYGFVQALDTYQSAVREGELSLVNSIDSKVGQLSNWVSQIQNGQVVRPEVAKQIADAADQLIDYISQGAQQKEQMFASQARVNGIEDAWTDFRSGFSSSYDEPSPQPIELTRLSRPAVSFVNPTANTLIKKYPYEQVEAFLQTYPDATEDEIKELIGQDFKKAGNASASTLKGYQSTASKLSPISFNSSPVPLLQKKFPQGAVGPGSGVYEGQCGVFVRRAVESLGMTYPLLGDSLSSKIAAVKKYGTSVNTARTGSVIVTKENPTYGHVAYIIGKNAKGWLVAESNFRQSKRIDYGRVIPFKSPNIIGVINPTKTT